MCFSSVYSVLNTCIEFTFRIYILLHVEKHYFIHFSCLLLKYMYVCGCVGVYIKQYNASGCLWNCFMKHNKTVYKNFLLHEIFSKTDAGVPLFYNTVCMQKASWWERMRKKNWTFWRKVSLYEWALCKD